MIEATARRIPERAYGALARFHRLAKLRFWRRVRAWRRLLRETQAWDRDRLADYQWAQIRELLAHSAAHVPHYRRLFAEIGAEPGDVRDLADFARLPTLTKADLQEHSEELLAENCPSDRREYSTTGGSTGVPVGFWFDKLESMAAEWAFITTLWARVGYRDGEATAVVRGDVVAGQRRWETKPFRNVLLLSSYYLTDEDLPFYLERLRRFRPRYIQAYPSSASLIARFMLERGERPIEGLRAVLCGSENVYDWQRAQIEEAFGCRVFSWYGQSERVCLAGECEHEPDLHIFPEYGQTELLDDAGKPITEPGRVGEVVGTAFPTRAMPLIRYRTNDAAVYADGPCPACGRPYPRFERIEGRLQEFIVSASGRPISMTAINMHSPVFDNVRQFRFVQDRPGEVRLKVVPKESFRREDDEPRIRTELAPKLGVDLELTAVEVVEDIPVGRSGKFQFLEQNLPVDLVRSR